MDSNCVLLLGPYDATISNFKLYNEKKNKFFTLKKIHQNIQVALNPGMLIFEKDPFFQQAAPDFFHFPNPL